MEHWNEEQNEKSTYTLLEVFHEVWNDKRRAERVLNQGGENLERLDSSQLNDDEPDDDSINRKRLNEMFNALFGCNYDVVIIKKGRAYILGEDGRVFIKLLLKSYSSENGKKLRKHKYEELDFQYENYLLYCATQFLEEREEIDGEKKRTKEKLRKMLVENFSLGEGAIQLKKSLVEFNKMIEEISKETELDFFHGKLAKKIDEFANYLLNDLPYED